MNSLKNLMIMVVLAAVGYGVYVSLARNNVDPACPPGVAEQWQPSAPKVELSSAPGGVQTEPSPIGDARPGGSLAIGTGREPAQSAPPFAQSTGATPSAAAPALTTAVPSATPPALTDSVPAATGSPVSSNPTAASYSSGSTAGGEVRNLTPPPGAVTEEDKSLQNKFASFMEEVHKSLAAGKVAEAHLALSTIYLDSNLPEDHYRQITGILDQLAGTVIYSRKHYLEPAYFAKAGETIEQVARQYNVPWQLLARINGLMPPDGANDDDRTKDQPLPEGMELKVVRGPFDAVVNLEKHELILLLQNRYAGRFPIGVGRDQTNIEGVYTVRDKILDPAYRGADGASIANNDPRNPLGEAWIGLSDRVGIHGAPDPRNIGRNDNQGSICVGARDIQDLYGILSVGSRVKITR